MIHSAEEFVALRSSDVREEYIRACHDDAPMDVWKAVVERFPEMRVWVARNKSIPPEIVTRLSTDLDPLVREAVARKRKAPEDVLALLARDPSQMVRQAVAANRRAEPTLLRVLANDEVESVASVARQNLADRGP